ncbi:hypothetical protein [Escherichia coli]|uniref:hypothetical protein n=1 Tax=Escherichia coli TaxID=562 RepID=UPI0006A58445|nr:hypothetical protein [Escherichia coli]
MYRTAIFFLMVLIVQPVFANSSTLAYSGKIGVRPYEGTISLRASTLLRVGGLYPRNIDKGLMAFNATIGNIFDKIVSPPENCKIGSFTNMSGRFPDLAANSSWKPSFSRVANGNTADLRVSRSSRSKSGNTTEEIGVIDFTGKAYAVCDISPQDTIGSSYNVSPVLKSFNITNPSGYSYKTKYSTTISLSFGDNLSKEKSINVVNYWFYDVLLDEGNHNNPQTFVKLKPEVESFETKNSGRSATATVKLTLKDNSKSDYLQLYKNGQPVNWTDEAYPVDGDMEFSVSTDRFGKMAIPVNVTVSMI